MILGIGIDLCDIARMEKMLVRVDFMERYFTSDEQAYIHGRGKAAAQSLAGNFAAKEAGLKAIGCGIAVPLIDISIIHDDLGAPLFVMTGQVLERMQALGGKSMHLSITHTNMMAAAVAILEG